MNITFLDPPPVSKNRVPERVLGCNYGLYPIPNIFLLTSAAVLEQAGCQVRYLNCPLQAIGEDGFEDFLRADDSAVYVFYSVNLAKETDLRALRRIRSERGGVRVVFIGPGPTYDADSYLADKDVVVVRGEPELTLKELAGCGFEPSPRIPGISYAGDGGTVSTDSVEPIRDLDGLPFPARHLISQSDYYNPKLAARPFTAVLTSRGCPYKCVYCVPCSLNFAREIEFRRSGASGKPPVRQRSASNVIDEFRLLKEQGYRSVSILDDEFALNAKRVGEICRGIEDLGLLWGCLARADSLDEQVVRDMARAGCQYIDIGVESFDAGILEYIGKDLDPAAVGAAVSLVKKYGITAKINILFGCSPLETQETIDYTLERVKEVDPDLVMFGICSPFPGTDYYEMAKQQNWFVSGDYEPVDVQKESIVSYPNLTKTELERAVRRANLKFFT
ncbi:MAG: B12-binding domain-containing radical SAM protein, partial [Terriglobia bacterium]